MSIVRQTVNSEVLSGIIDLPKSLRSKTVEVIVQPIDETDYLLSDDANKNHLMNSIKSYENKNDLKIVPIEKLEDAGIKK